MRIFLKLSYLFAFLQFVSLTAYGVGGCDSLIEKTFAERYEPLCYMYERLKAKDITEIENTLDELAKCAREKNDAELQYAYKLIKYQVYITEKIEVPHLDDSIELFLGELDRKKLKLLKAEALSVLSTYHWLRTKEYGPGFEYLLAAYEIYQDVPVSAFPPKYTKLYELASGYYYFGDYENTKKILMVAGRTDPGAQYNHPHHYNLLNLIGLCYRNTGVYDSAAFYFNLALHEADSLKRTAWVGILSGNLGIIYYLQKKYSEAIPLLEKDVRICLESKRAMENVPKSMALLAGCYLELGNTGKALSLLDSVRMYIRQENFWERHDVLQIIYPIVAKAYFISGQKDKAYAFLDSALAQKDSFYHDHSALVMAGARHKVDVEKRLADVQQLTAEKELERFTKYAWVTGILLMAGIIILFINRQKILHRRRSERMEAEKQQVETELANATIMLTGFTRSVHEKNELIEKISAEIEKLQSQNNGGLPDDYNETLLQLQDATILTDEQWEDFRRMFEKVHAGYLNRLKMKLPGLSPAETRIMALSKLKLSNKEMAGMLGISADAVRMSKHRLRKKLDLTEEGGIDELADMI